MRQKLQGVLTVTTPEDQRLVAQAAREANLPNTEGEEGNTTDPALLAGAVEREIFNQTRAEDTLECGGQSLVGNAYKRKLRQLAFNLRKNAELRAKVCAGALLPAALVKMDNDAMAPKEVQTAHAPCFTFNVVLIARTGCNFQQSLLAFFLSRNECIVKHYCYPLTVLQTLCFVKCTVFL